MFVRMLTCAHPNTHAGAHRSETFRAFLELTSRAHQGGPASVTLPMALSAVLCLRVASPTLHTWSDSEVLLPPTSSMVPWWASCHGGPGCLTGYHEGWYTSFVVHFVRARDLDFFPCRWTGSCCRFGTSGDTPRIPQGSTLMRISFFAFISHA